MIFLFNCTLFQGNNKLKTFQQITGEKNNLIKFLNAFKADSLGEAQKWVCGVP